jgi:uncharacterized membrane protein
MKDKPLAMWGLFVLVISVGLVLRIATLDRKSLWLDEVVTLRVAKMNVKNIIMRNAMQWEPHPPLYYVLMHYWVRLGYSEAVLRLPSAIMGAIAIPMLCWLVYEWGGRWSALASAWLLTIAPLHIWYSQEARMYALVCTLGLLSTTFYSLGIRRGKPHYWMAWIIGTLLGLYTDYSMMLILIIQIALLGPLWRIYGKRQYLWLPLCAVSIVLLLFFPQMRTSLYQMEQMSKGAGGYYISLQKLLSEQGISVSPLQLHTVVLLVSLCTLVLLFVLPWIIFHRRKKIRPSPGLLLGATGCYLLILVASAIMRGLIVKRQGLILLPYVLGGIASVISMSRHRSRLLIGLSLLTLPLTGSVVCVQEQESWRAVAGLLKDQATSQDIILVNASYMRLPLEYYYKEMPCHGIGPESVPEHVSKLITGYDRIWLVLSNDIYTDPESLVQRWLDENCVLLNTYAFNRIKVRVYRTGPE